MNDAKLIWITPDAEELIGKIARVSNPKNENNPDVEKLLKFLIRNKHWSPFEMASMCVEIKTTRAISPQILRHKSFSFQEFSQRYSAASKAQLPDLRSQDLKNRQSSIEDVPEATKEYYQKRIDNHFLEAFNLYESMLHANIAKECARGVLPLNTETRLYMSGTIRSWLHYCDLRKSNGTQAEHKSIAFSISDIIYECLPTIARAMWGE